MKVQNNKLANRKVHFSVGAVEFDANGVGELPDEFAPAILELEGYFPVEEEKKEEKKEEKAKAPDKKPSKEEKAE